MIARLLLIAALAVTAFSQKAIIPSSPDWTKPFPPFKIIGNVYWVGTYDLSTYLIATPAGNILINSGVESTVPQIQASVEKLGFKLSDTKILLGTHAHGKRFFESKAGHSCNRSKRIRGLYPLLDKSQQ